MFSSFSEVNTSNNIGFPSVFARKKRLRMEVGGGIIHLKQNPADGSITRFKYELLPFFDRQYYQSYLLSDRKLINGNLVITNE